MRAANANARKTANSAPEVFFRSSGRKLPLNVGLSRLFKAIWPTKRDMRLAAITGDSDRHAREQLAERAGYSGEAIARLLQTEDGLQVLRVLMGDARPAWWRRIQRSHQLAELRADIAKQQKAIAQYELQFGEDE